MKKIVIGLSGGMDSATLLGMCLERNYEVHICSFVYGSKHNEYEREAVENIISFYQEKRFRIIWHFIDLSSAFVDFNSNLLMTGGEIPEGHYEEESMKKTVVPGRNLIFASIMAGLAESIGAESIALGVHAGDHAIYPDCRPEFISHLREAIAYSSQGKVDVKTPLIHENKTSILKIGNSLSIPVPYHLTRTCYKDQPLSCGKCGSCQERLEAFTNINSIDPIQYE